MNVARIKPNIVSVRYHLQITLITFTALLLSYVCYRNKSYLRQRFVDIRSLVNISKLLILSQNTHTKKNVRDTSPDF